MEPNPAGPNMIDTTDSLEAINVFKSMKNFFFWLIILSMLIMLSLFVMVKLDWVQTPPAAPSENAAVSLAPSRGSNGLPMLAAQPQAPAEEPLQTRPARESGPLDETQIRTLDPIEQTAREVVGQALPEDRAKAAAPEPEPLRAEPEETSESDFDWNLLKLSRRQVTTTVIIFNYICLISGVLYSLTLLFALKVSLTGRLGGLRHIARAFFLSLFAFVFLFPWQAILPRVMIGAIYLPDELIGESSRLAGDTHGVLVILRFVGPWLVTFFLYVWAQMSSMKWSRATLKRLGVVR